MTFRARVGGQRPGSFVATCGGVCWVGLERNGVKNGFRQEESMSLNAALGAHREAYGVFNSCRLLPIQEDPGLVMHELHFASSESAAVVEISSENLH